MVKGKGEGGGGGFGRVDEKSEVRHENEKREMGEQAGKRREMGGWCLGGEKGGKKSLMWVAWLSCAIVTEYRANLYVIVVFFYLDNEICR